jgi:RNA polymerase sigma-70 factor (ECF subfamily)
LKDFDATSHLPNVRMPDAAAVDAFVRWDAEPGRAFEQLYRQCFHDVCRWARALGGLNADVEDIAQEVFLVARRKLEDFDGRHPRAWLYGITRRAVSDYRRRAWVRRVLHPLEGLFDVAGQEPSPSEVLQKRQAEKVLTSILDGMSSVRRAAFILYEIEGYSGEEIAELEGVPVKTVYTRLHYARKDFLAHVERLAEREEGGA